MNKRKLRRWSVILSSLLILSPFFVLPALAQEEKKKDKEEVKSPIFAPGPNPTLIPRYPDPSIVEIQKQLQNIMAIQKTLQFQHQQDIAEIQRITEQARIHQQILTQLSWINAAPAAVPEEEVERVMHREKIRLIEEQAKKNQAALEEIKGQELPKSALPSPDEKAKKGIFGWFEKRK